MKVKPNIGRLCLSREQLLVDNCSSITSYKAKRQSLQVITSEQLIPIVFPQHYRRPWLLLLQLQL